MSKNRTENDDTPTQPDQTIDTDSIVDLSDPSAIRIRRPDGVTEDRWSALQLGIKQDLAVLVEEVTGRCQDYTWCNMATTPDEHAEFHSGAIVPLAATEGEGVVDLDASHPGGFYCWPVLNRDSNYISIEFEGHWRDGGSDVVAFALSVTEVLAVLAATRNARGHEALLQLLGDISEPATAA
jgi:hypothetical protein